MNSCMYAWCNWSVKYLFPNIFQKVHFSLIQGIWLHGLAFWHKIWLGHNDPKPDLKKSKVSEMIVDQIAFTFFNHFPYFDHHFAKPSYLNTSPLSYALLPFGACLCARVSRSYSSFISTAYSSMSFSICSKCWFGCWDRLGERSPTSFDWFRFSKLSFSTLTNPCTSFLKVTQFSVEWLEIPEW